MKKHVLLFLLTAPPYGAFLLIGEYLFRSGVNTALPFFGWLLLLMVLGAAASADSRPVVFGTLCSLLFSENGDKKFLATILTFALPSAVENWSEELGISRRDSEMLYYFISGGAVRVIEQWVASGFLENEKMIADKLNSMILGAQSAVAHQ